MIVIFFLIFFNFLLLLNLTYISQYFNIFDFPDGKLKLHKKKIPIIGGLILIINFTIIFFYQVVFVKEFLSFDIKKFENFELFSLLILIYGHLFLGLYDDKHNLTASKKIFFSIAIILISILLNKNLIITNFSLTFIENRIFFGNLSIIFTIFCILILMNSLNFYDGINGQSCLIFLVFFSYLLLKSDLNLFYLICIFLIIMIMFLNLNNMLFLGDSGIYLLSIILSICLIYEHNIKSNIVYADEIFFLLLLPGFDLVRLTISRSLNSKNPFLGDRNHIHHLITSKFSLILSNFILFNLSILPIVLFVFFKLNFFLVFFIFLVIYTFLIQFLKTNDRK